ncbi:MAG: hypothetical protein QXJ02_02180 [Candidatus Bathyarchaeia archaeon]
MRIKKTVITAIFAFALASAFFGNARAQTSTGDMRLVLDFNILEVTIRVYAPNETRPAENITITATLTSHLMVEIKHFNLSVYGFVKGENKTLIASRSEEAFWRNSTTDVYNLTFKIPENVWGIVYGEVTLVHSAHYGSIVANNDGVTCGFPVTFVKNVYLEELENTLQSLNQTFSEIFGVSLNSENLATLNITYLELQQSKSDLENTRSLAVVLGITSFFFVATTLYLVLRKPKEYW